MCADGSDATDRGMHCECVPPREPTARHGSISISISHPTRHHASHRGWLMRHEIHCQPTNLYPLSQSASPCSATAFALLSQLGPEPVNHRLIPTNYCNSQTIVLLVQQGMKLSLLMPSEYSTDSGPPHFVPALNWPCVQLLSCMVDTRHTLTAVICCATRTFAQFSCRGGVEEVHDRNED
jgi:hypothetical protein